MVLNVNVDICLYKLIEAWKDPYTHFQMREGFSPRNLRSL